MAVPGRMDTAGPGPGDMTIRVPAGGGGTPAAGAWCESVA